MLDVIGKRNLPTVSAYLSLMSGTAITSIIITEVFTRYGKETFSVSVEVKIVKRVGEYVIDNVTCGVSKVSGTIYIP